ncbi:28S ribosomal protein S5, mitochondrial [Podochytrium sp. JEL0797]|nr:28S ribosomal protein S5, mitochondrial [Podochytrium sp. JEL0797]
MFALTSRMHGLRVAGAWSGLATRGFAASAAGDVSKGAMASPAKAPGAAVPSQPSLSKASNAPKGSAPRDAPRAQAPRGAAPRPSAEREAPLQKRVLHVRRVARSTKGGKIRSISAIVVVGNGNGVGGYGEGRASEAAGAVAKATAIAIKNMMPIERFQQRTVYGDINHRYHAVNFTIKTAPPGFGIVANNPIHEICRCIGIRDLAAKVRGSMNNLNVIKGFFEALQIQKTPTEIAQARGRKLVDIADAYYGGKI